MSAIVNHWINGTEFVSKSGRTAPVYDPALGTETKRVAHGSQVQQLQAIMTLGWSALLLGETVTLTMALSAMGIVACVLWALSNVNR